MKNILTIISKELSRVFKDKRLVFTTIIMPGLMIFILYSLIGQAIEKISVEDEDQESKIAVVNLDNNFETILNNQNFKYRFIEISVDEVGNNKDLLLKGNIDYIIIFPDSFKINVENSLKPDIITYYNPGENLSSKTNGIVNSVLYVLEEQYRYEKFNDTDMFTINISNQEAEVFNENKTLGKAIAMLLPFLIITMLFSGAMSVAPESIAGDKERGTMATLLVTPIKRSEIALGKIIALSTVSVLSASSSFIGIIASLPKLMGINEGSGVGKIYAFTDYLLVFLILIVTVLLIVGLISLLSALARNMKESNSFILPLYFVTMIIGISTMFSEGAQTNNVFYLIPIYNSLQCLVGIFTFEYSVVNFIITILINLSYTALLIVLLSRVFNNEKIMFSK